MHAARSDDEGTSPILGARVHRDHKQGSEQLLISLLVRTALEPATRPLQAGGYRLASLTLRRFRLRSIVFVPLHCYCFWCELVRQRGRRS
jgi:hypothetical protein